MENGMIVGWGTSGFHSYSLVVGYQYLFSIDLRGEESWIYNDRYMLYTTAITLAAATG